MADNSVFITGAAKGAFEDAVATLPPWATEKTAFKMQGLMGAQTKLLAELVKNSRTGSGANGSMTPADAAKLNSELDKLIKHLTDNNKAEDKKKKLDKDRADSDKKALLGVKEFSNNWQKAAFVLAGVEKIGAALLKVDQQYMKTSGELYKSGINLMNGNTTAKSSIDSLNQAVVLTHLRLEVLQEVAQKYSQTINAVGFTKFAKATGLATQGLKELAFSGPQTAELMGVYIESMQGFTDVRNRSEQELADDAIKLGTQMGRLSMQMGISQTQLASNLVATAKTTDSFLIMASKGETVAKNMGLFTSALGPAAGKIFESFSAARDPIYSATFQAMQRAGLGDVANDLAKIGKLAETSPEAANKALSEWRKALNLNQVVGLQDQLSSLAQGSQETADGLAVLARSGANVADINEDQLKKAIQSESTLTKWDTAVEHSASLLQAAFPPMESQIELLTTNLERLNSVADALIKHTDTETRSWVSAGLVGASQVLGGLVAYGGAKSVMNLFKGAGSGASATGAAAEGATVVEAGTAAGAGTTAVAVGTFAALLASLGVGAMTFKSLWSSQQEGIDWMKKKHDIEVSKKNGISVPTAPAPSAISSPSASSTNPKSEWDDNSTPSAGMPTAPMAPGIDKSPVGTDINSTLAAHTNILQQILLASENNVSVNKDILKYARNST